MKKIFINFVLIIILFFIYFLQANFFCWFNIAGIKPNLFIIYVLFIGLFGNKRMGILYGALTGVFLDLIIEERIGINLVGFLLISILAILFDKNFSKDSRMTIIFMVFGSTIIFELINYLMRIVLYSSSIELVYFLKILLIEVFFNVTITIIIYNFIQKFGYFIDNEYKGNKILTKYF